MARATNATVATVQALDAALAALLAKPAKEETANKGPSRKDVNARYAALCGPLARSGRYTIPNATDVIALAVSTAKGAPLSSALANMAADLQAEVNGGKVRPTFDVTTSYGASVRAKFLAALAVLAARAK